MLLRRTDRSRSSILALFSSVAVLIVVVATIGASAAWRTTQDAAVREATRDARYAADQAAQAIDVALRDTSETVSNLVATPGMALALEEPEGCSLAYTGAGPFTGGHLDIIDAGGVVRCTSGTPGASYPMDQWLSSAPKDGVVPGPQLDPVTGRSALVVAATLPEGVGYVAAFLELDALGPGLAELFSGRRDLEFVVTSPSTAQIVTRSISPATWSGRAISATRLAGLSGDGDHRDVDGLERIYARNQTSALGWAVFAGASRTTVLAEGTSDVRVLLLVVGGSLLVILAVFVVIYRRIVGPVRMLSRSTRLQRTRGETCAVPVVGPREVATVAREFNAVMSELAESEHSYRVLFEGSPQPMWVWAVSSGRFLAVNQAAVDRYGYSLEQFLGMRIDDVLGAGGRDAGDQVELLGTVESWPLTRSGPWTHTTAGGEVFMVEITAYGLSYLGEAARFAVMVDVTDQQEHERQLRHLALHDELTGLANRTLVLDRLTTAMNGPTRARMVVLYIAIDRFKLINEVHGHDVGDGVLITVGERLSAAFRGNESIGRTGSDEFIVVCPLITETAVSMASRIEGLFAHPVHLPGAPTFLTASVGISISSSGCTAEGLVRDAMTAMYRAKERGGDRFEVFDERVRARTLEKLEVNNELRRAIQHDELCLQYQPEIDLATGRCAGVEALVRWNHPTRGLLAPAHFIDLAEETGFIIQIGGWVLEAACHQAAEWLASGMDVGTISINLSARELAQPALVSQVSSALDRSGLPPNRLCLEITETSLMEDPDGAVGVLASLRDLGVKLSIDDFGTGYSSLQYLLKYRVDHLKVDRSFVSGLGDNAQSDAIVTSVIQLAHAFDLTVVAEGVETLDQAEILMRLGCDVGQGYLWSRPVWPTEVRQLCGPVVHPLPVHAHVAGTAVLEGRGR